MPNILDYLEWRGDLPLAQCPFCDVDALILSRLSYAPFDGIVSEDFSAPCLTIAQAAETCLALVHDKDSKRSFRIESDEGLLKGLIASPRFAELKITGYVNRFNEQQEEQFSALTVLLSEGELFVAFRGTDGTIIGWKEDFNMSFAPTIPAQRDAVEYLEQAASRFPGTIRIGGHSKGGNLAVYAAAFCKPEVQQRITHIRNNDGPGFQDSVIKSDAYQRITGRVRTFLPQSSVVGMLLEHEEDFCIVHSTNVGLTQHDVYSWQIARNGFIPVEGFTNSSQFIDRTLKDWVQNMTPELREKMINGVFEVVGASDGVTLRDLWNGKNTLAVIKALGNMDEETKELMKQGLRILRTSMKKALPGTLEQWASQNPALARLLSAGEEQPRVR